MKFYVRKTIKIIYSGLVISDVYEVASQEAAEKAVSGWQKGGVYGGGWLGPEYKLMAVDWVKE